MNSRIVKFLIDLAEGAVMGAAVAVLALPDSLTDGRVALLAAAGGAIGGAKAVARVGLGAYVESRKPA